jgi:hypothetical protein
LTANGAFIRYTDGELYYHSDGGFQRVDVNVAAVSAGAPYSYFNGTNTVSTSTAFIRYTDGELFEWDAKRGFQFICDGVADAQASLTIQDRCFIQFNNGQFFEHDGTSPSTGFTSIAQWVTSFSPADTDPATHRTNVYYVQSDGTLASWNGIATYFIDSNAIGVSASQFEKTAFVLYSDGTLEYYHAIWDPQTGFIGPFTFALVDHNVAGVSTGWTTLPRDNFPNGEASAYYITRAGVLVEWQPLDVTHLEGSRNFLDVNVQEVEAAQFAADRAFIVYDNGELFELQGTSRLSGPTFIDVNVGVPIVPPPQQPPPVLHQPVSVDALNTNGVFIRYDNGDLYYHSDIGFDPIDFNVAAISAGAVYGHSQGNVLELLPTVFVVHTDGTLYEWDGYRAFQFIDANVASVQASQELTDAVLIRHTDGTLLLHEGTSSTDGFTVIAGGVTSYSLGYSGVPWSSVCAFYVQTNHMLSVWSRAGGYQVIDGNVASVSADQSQFETAYVLYTTGALYRYNPNTSGLFQFIDGNVVTMSAGRTQIVTGFRSDGTTIFQETATVDYVTTEGNLIEWQPPDVASTSGTYLFVASGVAEVSASQFVNDEMFIVFRDGLLYETLGIGRLAFHFIDSNVKP